MTEETKYTQRAEALMDELFLSVSHIVHYLNGMLEDMKNKTYVPAESASADLTFLEGDVFRSAGDALYELQEMYAEKEEEYEDDEDITTELPIALTQTDVIWDYYGRKK